MWKDWTSEEGTAREARICQKMIPPVDSLVKYDKPVLVSSAKDKSKAKKTKAEALGVDKKGKALQTEDILNAILPPRLAFQMIDLAFVESV